MNEGLNEYCCRPLQYYKTVNRPRNLSFAFPFFYHLQRLLLLLALMATVLYGCLSSTDMFRQHSPASANFSLCRNELSPEKFAKKSWRKFMYGFFILNLTFSDRRLKDVPIVNLVLLPILQKRTRRLVELWILFSWMQELCLKIITYFTVLYLVENNYGNIHIVASYYFYLRNHR